MGHSSHRHRRRSCTNLTKGISSAITLQFAEQPWRQIVGMRSFAGHQYDDLDPGRVWRTVTKDVPVLRTYLADVVLEGLS